jgi:hypothetical protein
MASRRKPSISVRTTFLTRGKNQAVEAAAIAEGRAGVRRTVCADLAAELEDVEANTFRRTVNRAIEHGQLVAFRDSQGLEHIGLPARGQS